MNTRIGTNETRFVGRNYQDIIITRFGQNDYSAWFTDNPYNEISGYSVRGSLLDIIEEVRDEVPARKITDNTERLETIGTFIDIFEDFLEAKGIDIPNEDKEQDENAAIIYGMDYAMLSDKIEQLLTVLGVFDETEEK